MTTDFNYGKSTIITTGPVKPKDRNVPMNARYRVEKYADIATIPVPAVGELVFVLSDENNDNQQNIYVIKSLKPSNLGVADSLVDEVVPLKTFLGTDDINLSDYVTEEELNNRGYATTTEVDQKIANAVTGGTVDLSSYATKEYVDGEIDNISIPTKLSELQNDMDFIVDGEEVNATSLNGKKFSEPMTKAQYDAIVDKDEDTLYLVDDNESIIGIPDYSSTDANKILAVNSNGSAIEWIDAPTGSGSNIFFRSINTGEIFVKALPGESYGNIVVSTNSISINEGSSSTFTVKLDSAPTNNQVINISVSNSNSTVDKSELTFTPENYNIEQTVTINTTASHENYNNTASTITLANDNVSSKTINVTIVNTDIKEEESYGNIVVSTDSISINEGSSSTFTVKLDSAPTNNQNVNFSIKNSYCRLDNTSLTFTPENYNIEQTVTITCIHDSSSYFNKIDSVSVFNSKVGSKTIKVTIVNTDENNIQGELVQEGLYKSFVNQSGSTTFEDTNNFIIDKGNATIVAKISKMEGASNPACAIIQRSGAYKFDRNWQGTISWSLSGNIYPSSTTTINTDDNIFIMYVITYPYIKSYINNTLVKIDSIPDSFNFKDSFDSNTVTVGNANYNIDLYLYNRALNENEMMQNYKFMGGN